MTFMCVCVVKDMNLNAKQELIQKRNAWSHEISKVTFTAYNMKLYATNMELNKIKCNMKLE